MSHRTQITLEDEQYDRLRAESRRTGLGLAELVRRALDATYGGLSDADRVERLDLSFGSWTDLQMSGEDYVDNLRGGLGDRLDAR